VNKPQIIERLKDTDTKLFDSIVAGC